MGFKVAMTKSQFVTLTKSLKKSTLYPVSTVFIKSNSSDPTCNILSCSRLVPKPNCDKVPKEICVNTKKSPRRVKKPVVKEWCYRPKDLLENPGTFPGGLLNDINNNNSNNNNNDDGVDEDSEAVPSQRRRQKKLFSLFY